MFIVSRRRLALGLTLIAAAVVHVQQVRADFFNVPVPPDADKPGTLDGTGNAGDDTCWQATASNILASVGYGTGANLQARVQSIYDQMTSHFGFGRGKTKDALNWWLTSSNNIWPTNPYRRVDLYGHLSYTEPYKDSGLKSQIMTELRNGNRVALSIAWPEDKLFPVGGRGGHAISAWGDDGNLIGSAPVSGVYITDSDSDWGGDVQFYTYDDYDNPNVGGPNGSEGKGWYINYKSAGDNAFIKNISVLRPVAYMPLPGIGNPVQRTRRLTGSMQIKQPYGNGATALSYRIDSTGDIYDYHTEQYYNLAVQPNRTPVLNANQSLNYVDISYDFSGTPVEFGKSVTLTNSIIVSDIDSDYVQAAKLEIKSPQWHYLGVDKSAFKMDLKAAVHPTHFEPNPAEDAPEGYIVASMDFFDDPTTGEPSASYRFLSEFLPGDSDFVLFLEGVRNEFTDGPLTIGNLRFGYVEGEISTADLWDFDQWLVTRNDFLTLAAGAPITDRLGIDALLPRSVSEVLPEDLVPEPSSAMVSLGLGMIALRRRSRRS